jgi:DNA invertase Pin-like site-specific DNA recombinase
MQITPFTSTGGKNVRRIRRKATTFGYLRVSTDQQTVESQKLGIMQYCKANMLQVDEWVDVVMSASRSAIKRRIKELMGMLHPGDTLIVSELSRLSRSLFEMLDMIDQFKRKEIRLIAVKEGIDLEPGKDIPMPTKITIQVFGMLAEVSRDLLSLRVREGQQRAKKTGKHIGRKRGSTGKSKLDKHRKSIEDLLALGITKPKIAEICGCSVPTMYAYCKKHKLQPNPDNPLLKKVITQ